MICENCLYYELCDVLDENEQLIKDANICVCYCDKSEWIHFPIKDYKIAYYALGYGDDARVIEEPIHGLAVIKNGRHCIIDKYEDLYEIGEEVFLTKEKAEKEVERRKNR